MSRFAFSFLVGSVWCIASASVRRRSSASSLELNHRPSVRFRDGLIGFDEWAHGLFIASQGDGGIGVGASSPASTYAPTSAKLLPFPVTNEGP
jgi:hypothetical protein